MSDKTGVVELAKRLHALGVELLSTGGTARAIGADGIPVTEVSEYTGFPEMLDGRLKTLHPRIHGGILGRRGVDERDLAANDIPLIDLVVVNLYPFERTVRTPGCDMQTAIENIDIGGPTLLRAAAKNQADVAVVVDAADYGALLDEIEAHGEVSASTRARLAAKAFAHTARYEAAIANYLSASPGAGDASPFSDTLTVQLHKVTDMRYGENPHQRAALYAETEPKGASLVTAIRVQGKELSYNNVADADAALECVATFEETACVIVKHANPCGVAVGDDVTVAYDRAYATDPSSAFGGIIAFNRCLDAHTAKTILERQFVEVIIAPGFDDDARVVLAQKPNVRVLDTEGLSSADGAGLDCKRVAGGVLIQDRDGELIGADGLKVVTARRPSEAELDDLMFAWKVVKFVKSNAIVYARDGQTIGIGAGQTSRVHSARIAAIKAVDEGLHVDGAVMASDAFFPFRDGIDAAHEVGVSAVIQPGGSVRDEEVIAAADEHGMSMVFTGMRHFRH